MAAYRFQIRSLSWPQQIGLVLITALGIAAAIALVLLSVGLAIVLLPVVAIAILVGRWRLKRMMAEAQRRAAEQQENNQAIEIDYRVVDRD